MSYQVIARKWRPKGFNEIVGQNHISQTLLNALKNKRLPHALLFTGPRGTGKTSSARILAKALRCPDAQDYVPCNVCSDCQDISSGRSVNVIEIDGASNNGVDAIRELRDTVSYMPSSGFYKVYIIDEVHMLSTSAFNALLKTLEEPPEHVIFVMATTEVHKIPNTILSRCQRFDFRRISLKLVADHLKSICEKEGVEAEDDALWTIARQGDGSMRDSQSLLDQVITFSDKQITLQKVVDVLGLTDRTLLTKTLEALIDRDTQGVLTIIESIFSAGFDPKVFVQDLLEELRHLLIVKVSKSPDQQVVDLPESEIQHLQNLGSALSEEDIHLLFDMTLKGANEIPKAQDSKIVLEMLLLRMSSAPRIVDLAQAFSKGPSARPVAPVAQKPRAPQPAARFTEKKTEKSEVTAPVRKPEPPPVQQNPSHNNRPATPQPQQAQRSQPQQSPRSPQPTHSAPAKPAAPKSDQERWLELIARIKKVNPMMASQLEHLYVNSVTDKKISLSVPEKMKFLNSQIDNPDFIKKLTNYTHTFWGQSYDIEVTGSSAPQKKAEEPKLTAKEFEHKQKQDEQQKAHNEVTNHPLIKEFNSYFETEIHSIKELQ